MLLKILVIVIVSTVAVIEGENDEHISDIIEQRVNDILSVQMNEFESKINVLLSKRSQEIEKLTKRTMEIDNDFKALLRNRLNIKERFNRQEKDNTALKNSVTVLRKQKENLEKQFSMLRNETETVYLLQNKMCENRKPSKDCAKKEETVSNISENFETPTNSTAYVSMESLLPKTSEPLYNSRKRVVKRSAKRQDVSKYITRQNVTAFVPTAFHAALSRTLTNASGGERLKFDKVLTNVGNSYKPSTGIFVCPADGIYVFSATILSYPDKFLETEIVLNGNAVAWIYSYNNQHASNSGSNTVLVELHASDAVWVRVSGSIHDSGRMGHSKWTTFSGFNLWRNP